MTDFTPAERAALDRVAVPPLSPDFAARVRAAAASGTALPPLAPRRRMRSLWRHHRAAAIGIGALLLTSAAAAATGVIRLPVHLPSLAAVIATVSPPAPRPKPTPHHPKPHPQRLAAHPMPAPTPTVTPLPSRFAERHPILARRIAQMTPDQRAAAALRLRHRIRQMPPQQRRPAIRRLREIVRQMPPEQRAELRETLRQRRAQRRIERGTDLVPGALPPPVIERRRPFRERWRARREGFADPIR